MTARLILAGVTALLAAAGVALVLTWSPASKGSPAPSARAASASATAGGALDPAGRAVARRAVVLTAAIPRDGYSVRFERPRPGVRAQIDRELRVIAVFVRPGDPAHRVAHDLAHELGHAFDDRRMSDADRAAYLGRRGAPGAGWWPHGRRSDFAYGAGDFAEVFARCWVASPDFRSTMRPAPADACAMLPTEARPR